jgi:D-alanyl-D-alanine carboxypeptidase
MKRLTRGMKRLTQRSAGTGRVAVLLVGLLLAAAYSDSDAGPVGNAESATTSSVSKAPPLRRATRGRIKAAIDRGLAQTGTGGAAFGISVPGRRTYVTARGVADTATRRRMTARLAAPIGSITKTLTVTILLQLADEGRVELDSTIDRWYPRIPQADRITLRMLANMTSGIGDYVDAVIPQVCARPQRRWRPGELIRIGAALPRAFEQPGSAFSYSTTNTIILGRVIERVTGRSYKRNLRARLLKPLGLRRTGLKTGPTIPEPFAHGYTKVCGNRVEDTSRWSLSWGWAGGALYGTVRDLLRWGRALGTGATLSRRAFADRLTSLSPPTAPGVLDWYGLGVELAAQGPERPFVYHTGEVLGNEAIVQYYPATGAAVAILVNGDGGSDPADNASGPLLAVLTELRPILIPLVNGR